MQAYLTLAVAVLAVVGADHAPGYAPAPEYWCRDTNTSIYAEVCVPAFADQVTPVELAIKNIVDDTYCFDRVLTVCEETSTVVDRKICTNEYARDDVVAPCTTTQVTFEDKSETMKVTSCHASGYAAGYGSDLHHGYGEHQYCREEYQTQAYRVPLVTAPKQEECKLAYPAPKEVCVTKSIEITEVKCEDKVEKQCIELVKWEDSTIVIDQKETVIGEPSCEQLTLTLPTQACSKHKYPEPHYG